MPSSRHLARLMTATITPGGGRVLELGAGTGVFTRAILDRGLPASQLDVIESNPAFVWGLQRDFPDVTVLPVMAQDAGQHVSGTAGDYQAIISGLPLMAMPKSVRRAIVDECIMLLAPGGRFIQFTYATRSPLDQDLLDALGLNVIRAGRVYRNWPPASVFHYVRKALSSEHAGDAGTTA